MLVGQGHSRDYIYIYKMCGLVGSVRAEGRDEWVERRGQLWNAGQGLLGF